MPVVVLTAKDLTADGAKPSSRSGPILVLGKIDAADLEPRHGAVARSPTQRQTRQSRRTRSQ